MIYLLFEGAAIALTAFARLGFKTGAVNNGCNFAIETKMCHTLLATVIDHCVWYTSVLTALLDTCHNAVIEHCSTALFLKSDQLTTREERCDRS